jgi:hypothetical protein
MPPNTPSSIDKLLDGVRVAAALPDLHRGDDGRREGDDAAMAKVLDAYLAGTRAKLQPILADPIGPEPPPADPGAAALALLSEARPVTALEATAHLVTLASGLVDGELAWENLKAAAAHRDTLASAAQSALHFLEAGALTDARERLSWIRKLVDGDPQPPDWVLSAAAARMARQTDLALRLLDRPR